MRKYILFSIIFGISLMFLPPAFADLSEGLEAYYPFNGNAKDETGNGYDGTVEGATLTEDRNGNPANAYAFDGIDDYINLGTSLDVPSWTNYAVSLWFLHDGGGTTVRGYGQKILSKSTWYEDFHLLVNTSEGGTGALRYWTTYHSGWGTSLYDERDFRDNQWHHVVVNKKGNDGTLWVDGIEVDSSSMIYTVFNDEPLLVGFTSHGDIYQRHHFSGKIDDIRIYDRVLSESEIMELFYGYISFSNFVLTHASIKYAKLSDTDDYYIKGKAALGEYSDGIDPIGEIVKIKVGTSTLEIPAGSFNKMGKRKYKFMGKIGDARVCMELEKSKSNGFEFMASIKNIDLADTPNPVPIEVQIGNDMGQTDIWLTGVLKSKKNFRF